MLNGSYAIGFTMDPLEDPASRSAWSKFGVRAISPRASSNFRTVEGALSAAHGHNQIVKLLIHRPARTSARPFPAKLEFAATGKAIRNTGADRRNQPADT